MKRIDSVLLISLLLASCTARNERCYQDGGECIQAHIPADLDESSNPDNQGMQSVPDLSLPIDISPHVDKNESLDTKNVDDLSDPNKDLALPKDLTDLCYRNSFTDDKGLVFQLGGWKVTNGTLQSTSYDTSIAYIGGRKFKDFNLKIKGRVNNERGGGHLLVPFRYTTQGQFDQNRDTAYMMTLDTWDGINFNFGLMRLFTDRLRTEKVGGNRGTFYQLEVNARGPNIDVIFEGKSFQVPNNLYSDGYIGFASAGALVEFDDLEVCPK